MRTSYPRYVSECTNSPNHLNKVVISHHLFDWLGKDKARSTMSQFSEREQKSICRVHHHTLEDTSNFSCHFNMMNHQLQIQCMCPCPLTIHPPVLCLIIELQYVPNLNIECCIHAGH